MLNPKLDIFSQVLEGAWDRFEIESEREPAWLDFSVIPKTGVVDIFLCLQLEMMCTDRESYIKLEEWKLIFKPQTYSNSMVPLNQ